MRYRQRIGEHVAQQLCSDRMVLLVDHATKHGSQRILIGDHGQSRI